MSGIYGVISKKAIDVAMYKGLRIWNKNYGDLQEKEFYNDKVFVGIHPEYLKGNEEEFSLIWEKDSLEVFDCLLYSNTDCSIPDSEYLHDSISKGGLNSLKDINGDFAGVVYDLAKRQLILFRDHMGVRPLYYYDDDDRVIFSTDIRGILSIIDVDVSINEGWLYRDLCGYSTLSAEQTEYEKIKCVPFGGYVVFSFNNDCINCEKYHYWIPGSKKIRFKNKKEYANRLRGLIEDAIRIRVEATNQFIGAELSGGLDSGVIDLLLARIRKGCKYYSWTPSEEVLPLAERDERLVIKDICEKAGIECGYGGLNVDFGKNTLLKQRFPLKENGLEMLPYPIQYAFPMYVNTPSIYETACFMKDNGVKLIFTGHGGDEGASHRANPYELFYYHEYFRYLQLMFSRTDVRRRRIWGTVSLIYQNLSYSKNVLLKPFSSKKGFNKILSKYFYDKFSHDKMEPLFFAYAPQKYIIGGGSRNRLDVLSFYSACVGVRYLIPLLDYRVIDFALGIPRYLYQKRYNTRVIFREAFKDILPESLYNQVLKESTSYRNLVPKDDSYYKDNRACENIIKKKQEIIEYLDSALWEQYLDYNLIDDWVHARTSVEDDTTILNSIFKCIQFEYTIKRAREVNNLADD